jgi:NADPH:quinone reductase-like Zn-dependent oxidoreductase
VAEVGPGVTEFAEGDRVFGFQLGGAHAEYMTVKADGAVLKTPDALSDAEAAALPFGALCSLEFLDRFAGVKPGERVLVVGASGGVGAYAVQIARALGAEVTGVASAARPSW